MSVLEWTIGALLFAGAFLMFVGALGVVRFPDVFTRMSAASKTSTLGAICVLLGYGLAHAEIGVDLRALAAIVFLALTAPVGAHAIGRAAYGRGDALWKGTRLDELARDRDHAGAHEGSEVER